MFSDSNSTNFARRSRNKEDETRQLALTKTYYSVFGKFSSFFYLNLRVLEHVQGVQPLENSIGPYSIRLFFPYRDKNVRWRKLTLCMCVDIMSTNDSKGTWSVTWTDVMFVANLMLLPFWLVDEWTNFKLYIPRFLLVFWSPSQLKADVKSRVKSLQPFSDEDGSNPLQYIWAVTNIFLLCSNLISLVTFLFGDIFFIV